MCKVLFFQDCTTHIPVNVHERQRKVKAMSHAPGQFLQQFCCQFQSDPNKEVIVKSVQIKQNDAVHCYVENPGELLIPDATLLSQHS